MLTLAEVLDLIDKIQRVLQCRGPVGIITGTDAAERLFQLHGQLVAVAAAKALHMHQVLAEAVQ